MRRLAGLVERLPDVRGRSALAHRLYRPRSETWRVRSNGFQFDLPASSIMAWRVAFTGRYDQAEQEFLKRFIEPDSAVIDVGAALGLWTVPLAAWAAEDGGEVLAFEPMPANVKWVERNLALNGLQDTARVSQTALGREAGTVTLSSGEPDGGNAVLGTNGGGPTKFEVPVSRLDDFPRQRRVSFIKLDVEGFEPEVLRGAQELLSSDRPVIFGEFSRHWMDVHGIDPEPCFSDLKELGYTMHGLGTSRSRRWLAMNRAELAEAGSEDLVFLPPN